MPTSAAAVARSQLHGLLAADGSAAGVLHAGLVLLADLRNGNSPCFTFQHRKAYSCQGSLEAGLA